MKVIDFNESVHLDGVRKCLIELQDVERNLDHRLPTGAEIVEEYIPKMLENCKNCDGKVLVADVDGEIVGYATILTRVTSDEIEDGGLEYGLVSDLMTADGHRRQGIGRALLEAAEDYARERGTKWLRIGVLAANQLALDIYQSQGYSKLYVELEKDLGHARH